MSLRTAKCKQCRREGEKLFLKGERCNTQKCAMVRRATLPGKNPKDRIAKLSEFGKQLREKQKAKKIFGISEKVFRNYYAKASKLKGVTGDNLLSLLERRVDNIVYKAGFADSRAQARQMVTHGLFTLNGKKIDIPSISAKEGDVLVVRDKAIDTQIIQATQNRKIKTPKWLKVDIKKYSVSIERLPEKDELEKSIAINLIIEFYSR